MELYWQVYVTQTMLIESLFVKLVQLYSKELHLVSAFLHNMSSFFSAPLSHHRVNQSVLKSASINWRLGIRCMKCTQPVYKLEHVNFFSYLHFFMHWHFIIVSCHRITLAFISKSYVHTIQVSDERSRSIWEAYAAPEGQERNPAFCWTIVRRGPIAITLQLNMAIGVA